MQPPGMHSLTNSRHLLVDTTAQSIYLIISMYICISTDIIRYMPPENNVKILQTMDDSIYARLEKIAKKKGITVQELIRAVIIPSWLEEQKD